MDVGQEDQVAEDTQTGGDDLEAVLAQNVLARRIGEREIERCRLEARLMLAEQRAAQAEQALTESRPATAKGRRS